MNAGVSPLGMRNRCSPVFMSIAVIEPKGGFQIGLLCTTGRA
jgi:hypothetical protein